MKTYSAVIVLAHHMDKQGNLGEESAARLRTAVEAFQTGEAPLLITTGWSYRDDTDLPIGTAMRDEAIRKFGLPEGAVIADTEARDTVGDAVFTKRNLALPRKLDRLLIVTSAYHVVRSLEIFSFVYGPGFLLEGRGAPVFENEERLASEAKSAESFRQTFKGIQAGNDKAIYERLRERHPFYNGKVYPTI